MQFHQKAAYSKEYKYAIDISEKRQKSVLLVV